LVNVNDIYAMGGEPLGMTNNVSYTSEEEGEKVANGIREACEKRRWPMGLERLVRSSKSRW
jgi:selenophosphate synthetase-related protein